MIKKTGVIMYDFSKQDIRDIQQLYENFAIRNENQIVEQFNDLFLEVSLQRKKKHSNLQFANRKGFLPALSIEEVFLLQIHKDTVLSIFNLAFYQSLQQSDYRLLRNGIYSYNRLRIYERIKLSDYNEWCALASLAIFDLEALKICFSDTIELGEISECCDMPLLSVNNLLRTIISDNDVWKEKVIFDVEQHINDIKSKFEKGLIRALVGIIKQDTALINLSLSEMLEYYKRCKWLHDEGYYGCKNLFKYCPLFIMGIHNLALLKVADKSSEILLPDKTVWLKEFIIFCDEDRNFEPFIQYSGKIEFLNDYITRIAQVYPTKRKNIKTAWEKNRYVTR
jgi:hypothetical protein